MKKLMIVALTCMVMVTGCGSSKKSVEADSSFKPITVNSIEVKPIEVEHILVETIETEHIIVENIIY